MVSAYAIEDIERMQAEGLNPTLRDIIRLNALGCKVENAAVVGSTAHTPRLVFMPRDSWWHRPLVFREPTVGHELWMEAVAPLFADGEGAWRALNGFALAHEVWELPRADRPERVVREVVRFAANRLTHFTARQLKSALAYAVFGNDWRTGENPQRGKTDDQDGVYAVSPMVGLLTSARMLRLPISLDDARRMTSSEFADAVNLCFANSEDFDAKAFHATAQGEYAVVRDEIKGRLLNEKRIQV